MARERSDLDASLAKGVAPASAHSARAVRMGYNHDIPHRGRMFHVQTEDSGRSKGHIFTHVFHAGTIVASHRVDYKPGLSTNGVISLLRESHKTMARRLVRGLLDETIDRSIGRDPQPGLRLAVVEDPSPSAESPVARAIPGESGERPAQMQRAVAALDAADIARVIDGLYHGLPGAIGVALADYESGLCLGVTGSAPDLDIELAAAGNMEVMKAKAAVMRALGIEGGIEDILVTLDAQYHVIRPVGSVLFLYLAMERERGNLAVARLRVAAAGSELLDRLGQWTEPSHGH